MLASLLAVFGLAPLQAGFGAADITPSEPLPLGGYTERQDRLMDGVGERLYARCLRLRQGDADVALISVEMLTVPAGLAETVAADAKAMGFRGEVFLAATHTHSAPDSQLLNPRMRIKVSGIASYSEKWLRWYAKRIASSIPANLANAKLGVAYAKADLSRPRANGGVAQTRVSRLTASWKGGKATLLQYAAHPTLLDSNWNTTAGDWPGAWMRQGEGRLFFNGAMGDLSPRAPNGKAGRGGVASLADALEKVRFERVSISSGSALRVARFKIEMPPVVAHPKFAERNNIPQSFAQALVQSFAPLEAYVTIVRFGDFGLIGVPGELSSPLGKNIESAARAAGVREPVVVSFVNDWVGYVVTPGQYAEGGYEATLAFHGPMLGERIVKSVRSALGNAAAE